MSAEQFSVAGDAGKSEIVCKNQDTERGIGVAATIFVFHLCVAFARNEAWREKQRERGRVRERASEREAEREERRHEYPPELQPSLQSLPRWQCQQVWRRRRSGEGA